MLNEADYDGLAFAFAFNRCDLLNCTVLYAGTLLNFCQEPRRKEGKAE